MKWLDGWHLESNARLQLKVLERLRRETTRSAAPEFLKRLVRVLNATSRQMAIERCDVVVLKHGRSYSTKPAKESEAKIRTWMATKGVVADDSIKSSGVETTGYDPPFTPGPLRRNEVLIRL
jgi:hypothetical protein